MLLDGLWSADFEVSAADIDQKLIIARVCAGTRISASACTGICISARASACASAHCIIPISRMMSLTMLVVSLFRSQHDFS